MIAWDGGGAGPRRVLQAGDNTVMSLRPLPDGALLVASADPWLGVIGADGSPRWHVVPKQVDPREQESNFDGLAGRNACRVQSAAIGK